MKVVLVTGAAGGIGSALCEVFTQADYYVVATDYHQPTLGHVNLAIDLLRLVNDLAYQQISLQAIADVLPNGQLDVLINNAALQIVAPVENLTLDNFRNSMDVNVSAAFLLIQSFLAHLVITQGSVINIATIHARLTKPEFVAYATSKTALLGLTQALAVDVGSKVRVNAISPAAIATPMLQAGFVGNPTGYACLEEHHPSARIGTPDEVAKLALFLASDDSKFINGANISIDGAIGVRLHDPV